MDHPLPPSIELAWGLREPASKGPKRGLTLERIVAAGVRVASVEGLAAVSMSRVAAELGASTMGLYRYVGAKDELLDLMVDATLGSPPPVAPGETWRDGLRRWGEGIRDVYRRHPWVVRVPITGPPLGPNNVRWLEDGLQSLAATPLDEQQKVSTVLLLSGFVRNDQRLLAELVSAGPTSAAINASYGGLLRTLTEARDFPAVHAAIFSGVFDDDEYDMNREFDFGLVRILDGIEVLIRSTARPKGKRP